MKKVLFSLLAANILFACGCTDSGSASSFAEQAKSNFEKLDKDFSKVLKKYNEINQEIKELVTTATFTLNESAKYQQVYQQSLILNLESRQQINALIQSGKDEL